MKTYTEKETIKIVKQKVKKFIKPKENEYFDKKEIFEAIEDETYEYFRYTDEINENILKEIIINYIHYAVFLTIKMRIVHKVHSSNIPIAKKDDHLIIIYDFKKDELYFINYNDFPQEWNPIVKVFEIEYDCNKAICEDCGEECSCRDKYDTKKYRDCYNDFIDIRIMEDDLWIDEVCEQLKLQDFEYNKLMEE